MQCRRNTYIRSQAGHATPLAKLLWNVVAATYEMYGSRVVPENAVVALVALGRAVGPRLMSGCGPGSRATCSAVLFGVLEAYPPVGTTPGVPGGELVAGYRVFMK
jgi:hypothetical protein